MRTLIRIIRTLIRIMRTLIRIMRTLIRIVSTPYSPKRLGPLALKPRAEAAQRRPRTAACDDGVLTWQYVSGVCASEQARAQKRTRRIARLRVRAFQDKRTSFAPKGTSFAPKGTSFAPKGTSGYEFRA